VQGYHVEVAEVKNKGRGVRATKDFKEGETLFSEIPLALARSMHSHFPPVTATHQVSLFFLFEKKSKPRT
jgi:hypothetical protein